jgi:hypothetical protein
MGGGLFGTPLYLNIKCILFSFFLIFVYYLPHPQLRSNNIIAVFLLGMSGYIILAWYDVLYNCTDQLGPTLLGWISKPFKPKKYSKQYDKLPVKYKKTIRFFDIAVLSLLVITFIFPYVSK